MGRFPLGRVVATPAALQLLGEHPEAASCILDRHASGDGGDVPPEDARENELSVDQGYRIVSNYPVGEGRVWILTEASREVPTILLPSEY